MRTVIVTGAAQGIGLAIAQAFAAVGDHVVLTDIKSKAGEAAAAAIETAGGRAVFHELDIRDTAAVDALVKAVAKRTGRLDVAVANAGVAYRVPIEALDDTAWNTTLDVNLGGSMRLLRAAGRWMKSAGESGALIAVSSVSARRGWPDHVHYNASKAAIEGLIVGLAADLGPAGIRANAILPGLIRTAQSLSEEHSLGPAGLAAAAGGLPLRRIGEPADVAGVAVFLASSAAAYITGQSLIVDGGMTIGSY